MTNKIYVFVIALIVAFLDQMSKLQISNKLLLGEKVNVFSHLVSFTKVYNTGAAFSLMQNMTLILGIFSGLVALVIIIYILKRIKTMPYLLILSWGLILGGTVGNMIDRIRIGYVIDFIQLDFIKFPIFNIADLSINLGAIILLLYMLFKNKLYKDTVTDK